MTNKKPQFLNSDHVVSSMDVGDGIRKEVWVIGPSIARELVLNSINMRRETADHINDLAYCMRNETFYRIGDSIIISDHGELLDGFQRMKAIILADVTLEFDVMVGVPKHHAIYIQQCVRPKRVNDFFKSMGVKNSSGAVSLTRGAMVLYEGRRPDQKCTSNPGVIYSFYTDHREVIDLLVKTLAQLNLGPISNLGPPLFIFCLIDYKKALDFITVLSGNVAPNHSDAAYHLRRRFLKDRTENRSKKFERVHRFALMIKAWNYWQTGRTTSRVTWNPTGTSPEEFPDIAGWEKQSLNLKVGA